MSPAKEQLNYSGLWSHCLRRAWCAGCTTSDHQAGKGARKQSQQTHFQKSAKVILCGLSVFLAYGRSVYQSRLLTCRNKNVLAGFGNI